MREAVIVSTARTPIGKAYRGAFNDTQAQALGGHVIANARRARRYRGRRGRRRRHGRGAAAGLDRINFARQCALRAGLPTSVAGMSVDRQCASGLMAIAIAAKEIVDDGMSITVGGGLEFDFAGPERQDGPLSRTGSLAGRAPRRRLHVDARDRRDRRFPLQDSARAAGRILGPVACRAPPPPRPRDASTPRSFRCPAS